jgi:hypothetical protein
MNEKDSERFPERPRPLRAEERAVMLALLNHADFEGRDEFLSQVGRTRVIGRCACGCATVVLAVDASRPQAAVASPIPIEATVLALDGQGIGGVLLFAADGRLSELEVYSFTDEPISAFPPPEQLRLGKIRRS